MTINRENYISNNYGTSNSQGDYEYELALFVKKFVEFAFNYFNIEQIIKDRGKHPLNLLNVMSVLIYGNVNGITSTPVMSSNCEFHELYKLVSNNLYVSDRTLRKYRHDYNEIFQKLLSLTLIFAYCIGFTDFYHIAVDGTILKAFNSPFNILKMEDINTLINHFTIKELSNEEIKELRTSAQNFLLSENFTDSEKLSILNDLKTILEKIGQKSIGINDPLARWRYNKKHRPQISYNIQHGVDVKSKLICGVNVSQSPTDHYEIPAVMDNIHDNLYGLKPKIVSADTIYRTIINATYLNEKDIILLSPTRKQGKQSMNRLNANPYSKDHFIQDFDNNVVICLCKQKLKPHGPYDCKVDKFGFKRQKVVYSNYKACQQCPKKKECCKKSKHRSITIYTHELLDLTEQLMELDENKKEYKKRSCVEGPNGTYIDFYHINELHIVGKENMQGIMDGIAASYNLKVLFNLFKSKEIELTDVFKVMDILTAPSSNFICNSGVLKNEQYSI